MTGLTQNRYANLTTTEGGGKGEGGFAFGIWKHEIRKTSTDEGFNNCFGGPYKQMAQGTQGRNITLCCKRTVQPKRYARCATTAIMLPLRLQRCWVGK